MSATGYTSGQEPGDHERVWGQGGHRVEAFRPRRCDLRTKNTTPSTQRREYDATPFVFDWSDPRVFSLSPHGRHQARVWLCTAGGGCVSREALGARSHPLTLRAPSRATAIDPPESEQTRASHTPRRTFSGANRKASPGFPQRCFPDHRAVRSGKVTAPCSRAATNGVPRVGSSVRPTGLRWSFGRPAGETAVGSVAANASGRLLVPGASSSRSLPRVSQRRRRPRTVSGGNARLRRCCCCCCVRDLEGSPPAMSSSDAIGSPRPPPRQSRRPALLTVHSSQSHQIIQAQAVETAQVREEH